MPSILTILIACSHISSFSQQLGKNPATDLRDIIEILKKAEIIEEGDEVLVHLEEICYLNKKLREFDQNFPWGF